MLTLHDCLQQLNHACLHCEAKLLTHTQHCAGGGCGCADCADRVVHVSGPQVLVIFTSMVVVAFVTLLQNPVLGSSSWLPLLAFCWAVAFVVTMVLQASLPLPDIQRCGGVQLCGQIRLTSVQDSFPGGCIEASWVGVHTTP